MRFPPEFVGGLVIVVLLGLSTGFLRGLLKRSLPGWTLVAALVVPWAILFTSACLSDVRLTSLLSAITLALVLAVPSMLIWSIAMVTGMLVAIPFRRLPPPN